MKNITLQKIDKKGMVPLLRKMVEVRCFEEAVLDLFQKGVLRGTTHTCIGQEAIAVGVCSELEKDDYTVSTHRGHGHYLGKGGDVKRLMAEIFGKVNGCCGGRGGSQNIIDLDIGFLGANGITGGGIPCATGAGLSIKYRTTSQVVSCFFGDGASNQGTFHESLNMAALWKLPVIYICENNYYAMSTPLCSSTGEMELSRRGTAYGMSFNKIDGNDIFAVKDIVKNAVERARGGNGPSLIEMTTYRHKGHSKSDQCIYRTREEENSWMERCPIKRVENMLIEKSVLTKSDLDEIHTRIKNMIQDAIEFAMNSGKPSLGNL